jgi:hypothetical protein
VGVNLDIAQDDILSLIFVLGWYNRVIVLSGVLKAPRALQPGRFIREPPLTG